MGKVRKFLDAGTDSIHIQRGNTNISSNKVVVIAGYSTQTDISKSVIALCNEFDTNDFAVVLCIAQDHPQELKENPLLSSNVVVLRRQNIGYDFGSWGSVLTQFPGILKANQLILSNDSLIGPFSSLGPLLREFESSTSDVWGLTKTNQFEPHLQSYFLGFRGGISQEKVLVDFWKKIPIIQDKELLVSRLEVGLSRLLFAESFSTSAFIYPEQLSLVSGNPTIDAWDQLLLRGIPFVKKQLLTNPRFDDITEIISSKVKELYGQDIQDWM